ncbi:chorismate-binding protein [Streptomyces sp. NPDC046727]|uniref:chorismate-binding protein n=1 Tax=Streptomyces sp. NPDC046727 TaxID=3155373 RepID=UPI0033ED363C
MSPDARRVAQAVIEESRTRAPDRSVLAFGSPRGAVVGLGARSWLSSRQGAWECCLPGGRTVGGKLDGEFDRQLDAFLTAHTGQWVIGYLGFDLNRRHVSAVPVPAGYPATHLVVPETVIEIDGDGRIRGDGPRPAPAAAATATPVAVSDAACAEFAGLARRVLDWIDGDARRRATVCVRSEIGFPVDLPATFAAGVADAFGLSRSFYAAVDGLEFAGTSPELLVAGSPAQVIATHKLSGTFASADYTGAADLPTRLVLEHDGSARRMAEALAAVGSPARGDRRVMRLGELSHLLTSFDTVPHRGTTEAAALLGLLPHGASPREAGLELIAEVESHPRGPYYGLFGVRTPRGELSWSQTLRSVFRASEGQWATVGAAVTQRSTPELEVAEIRMKAASITAVPAQAAGAGRGGAG